MKIKDFITILSKLNPDGELVYFTSFKDMGATIPVFNRGFKVTRNDLTSTYSIQPTDKFEYGDEDDFNKSLLKKN